jgi:hypothetical protein
MNKLILLALTFAVFTGCASALQKQSDSIVITYQAITRGNNLTVTAKQGSVQANSERMKRTSVSTMITQDQWEEVIHELDKIDLDKMSGLKAPSDKRFYDGAMIASLTVQLKDTTYQSSSFDHGNPPAEIKAVVDKLISLSGVDKEAE